MSICLKTHRGDDMKGKIFFMIALLAVFGMGCTQQATTQEAPAQAVQQPPQAVEAPVEAVAPAPAPAAETSAPVEASAGVDINISDKGFDPDTLSIKAGQTVTFVVSQGKHKVTINGEALKDSISEGQQAEYTFGKAGTYKVFDIFTKRSATINVS